MSTDTWLIALDRGGTFTDLVAHGPGGEVRSAKVLARSGHGLEALREVLSDDELANARLRVGTTVATNALLTGAGARTALFVTEGFADLPQIGHQARPRIFALDVQRESWPIDRVIEVGGRLRASGEVLVPLDLAGLRDRLALLLREGFEAVAFAFAHAVDHPWHEEQAARLAREVGFGQVVASHQVLPRVGLVDRAHATVVDASLTPVVQSFVGRVSAFVPDAHVRLMTSAGGLVGPDRFRGRDALLSGPAGGVAACARLARQVGVPRVLGFDMGGTSTDVCRWAGEVERQEVSVLAGRRIPLPGVDVVSVAAGGGSRLACVDGRARVGPESVGADPGPACYGRGRLAAVTDANLVLGRIQARWFPAVFGPRGDQPLDLDRARRAVARAAGVDMTDDSAVLDAAAGFLSVADSAMAEATASLSVSRGHDPRDHALIALGGAGPQHACAVAERLGIRRVLAHPRAGVLSAWGIARAEQTAVVRRRIDAQWVDRLPELQGGLLDVMRAEASEMLRGDGTREAPLFSVTWDLRYTGAQAILEVRDRVTFDAEHQRIFGFARPRASVDVLGVSVTARVPDRVEPLQPVDPGSVPESAARLGTVTMHVPREGARKEVEASVYDWDRLAPGAEVTGPALVIGPQSTVCVDPGWSAAVLADGTLDLVRSGVTGLSGARSLPQAPDAVGLELWSRRFMGIAERMGGTLQRVAWSTNIRERLDFSCAVFDSEGRLLANAPHIPVHLGAMGETVRVLRDALPTDALRQGRSWAVNDPRAGGSHLPDITVVTPVFDGGEVFAWVASRGHHADVGGLTPGSMPPLSTSLAEEGVLLERLLLVDDDRWCEANVRSALMRGPHPSREPDMVIADLQAQVAANAQGAAALQALRRERGGEVTRRWMGWILDHGEQVLQGWLESFDGPRHFADAMDDGTPIVVRLESERRGGEARLRVDFDGTGAASPHNLNAPRAVVRAATLYVLRCAMGRDIPLNDGVLRAVDLHIPRGCLLDPPEGAAVVGGNVETSQRIVDVLLGALGLAAASQGTMNNLCFGTARSAYYETIAGGAGATPQAPGAHCVHTHMTNTRITDPEVLERRYPVIVERFGRRRGSGGAGRYSGGDGVERILRFTEPVEASLLSQRRKTTPFGLQGGGSGAPGQVLLERDGSTETLPERFVRRLSAGDRLVIRTPGGGGFGPPDAAAV